MQRDVAQSPGPLPPGRPRDAIVAEVMRALQAIPQGASVVVGLSGGPDSVALSYLTAEARPDLRLVLGHVRHGLRDDREDVAVVKEHAGWLGAELEIVEIHVPHGGDGWEANARDRRYAALRRIGRGVGAGWVLVGHTADDQAETVLLRLARGTGLRGLAGMAPARGELVRPLLRLRRRDVHDFVHAEGLPSVEDPTNADPAFRRAVVRHDVLPVFRALGSDPIGALARLADLARDDADRLDDAAADLSDDLVRLHGPVVSVPVAPLHDLDAAMARRIVRRAVTRVRDSAYPPSAAQVATILSLSPGEAVDLPDARVTCGGGWLGFAPLDLPVAESVPLVGLGATHWPATGVTIRAVDQTVDVRPDGQLALDVGWRPVAVDTDPSLLAPGGRAGLGQVLLPALSSAELASARLRVRRDGDRVVTRAGTRKVQDVYVDAGVPRVLRDLLPILEIDGRIVWIPGFAVDADWHARGRTDPGLHLSVVRG